MKKTVAVLLLITMTGTSWTTPFTGHHGKHLFMQLLGIIHPHQHKNNHYTDVDIDKAEWVCRNPKTQGMIIITAEDLQQTRAKEQNVPHSPPGFTGLPDPAISYNPPNNQPGQEGPPNQPNSHTGNGVKPNDGDTIIFPTSEPDQNNHEHNPYDVQHGGDGLIDIRSGAK